MGVFWMVIFVGFVFGLFLNHFLPLLSLKNKKLGDLPRGSFGYLPFLGETLAFLNPHPSTTVGSFLQEHCSRYGKVFKSHLFFSPTIVSCDQELNYFILQNEDKLFECSYPKPIHGILGKISMLVAVGDTHKRLRNVALSFVSTTKSKHDFITYIEKTTLQILDSWKDKKQVIFCQEARKFTFNVIVKQVLGLTPEEPQTARILEDFLTFMRGLISFPLYIPGTPYANAVKVEHASIRSKKNKDEFLTWEDYKMMTFTQNKGSERYQIQRLFDTSRLEGPTNSKYSSFGLIYPFKSPGISSLEMGGSELARVEVAFFLHHLVQNFRWSVEGDDQPIAYPYVEFQRGLVLNVDHFAF
ncbi:hypothetical protein L1987_70705 [Smallanthus sonchifolius]|uniref:Uncharacterized protein n=1 Tax=Smallanthus sonchifolius TaxID=185202 RepID=A0ACB9AQZ8_9ASTR|nr:hypothetical protein L1987_70705 [Smallanthus sonchifolius]